MLHRDAFKKPEERWVRVAMFIGLSMTGLLPYVHYVHVYGSDNVSTVFDHFWFAM